MPALVAYFDDSGTHRESEFAVIAGYVASPAQWLSLAGPWQTILNRHGLKWFHMTDCEAGQREYKSIQEPDRHALIFDLAKLIDHSVSTGFRSAMPKQVFDEEILVEARRNPEMRARIKHAYALGYQHILHGVSLHCARTNATPRDVEIVFAIQPKIGYAARDSARKQFTRIGFPEPSFKEMRDHPALQAADMLAWMTHRELTKGRDAIEVRHAPLFIRTSASYIDEKTLRSLGTNLHSLHDAIERRSTTRRDA